ncbi:NAD(P)-binding protein [uncultured Amphritea sp.]|uniref:NAD(P)/FAD-dependent oxidoreductase n=1 Tax=uncultured Amphritea sp. TaxID=981605 RepID=UPI0026346E65|nr:NAD(P)-binding protein [uncultured Amphritea sp.]
MTKKIAIIGGGLAGSVLADRLSPFAEVTVFEKSRGTGGRMSSCRLEEYAADLGAPWFKPTSGAFSNWLGAQSEVSRWQPKGRDFNNIQIKSEPLYVANPRQSILTRKLCDKATLKTQCRVASVLPLQQEHSNQVVVNDDQGLALGLFDAAIITAPAIQAKPLLEAIPGFARIAGQAITDPCWVVVITLSGLRNEADLFCGEHEILYRCIKDSAKPGRTAPADTETWVIEATRQWSAGHIDTDAADVLSLLYSAFCTLIGQQPNIRSSRVHRWLLARHRSDHPTAYLWDAETGIGACGDWLKGNGLEASWASANAMADELEHFI